jgi:hypothetical protein
MTTLRTLTLCAAIAALSLPAAAFARHGGNDGKTVTGSCTKASTSKLKVKADDGRLATEFEVDQNRNGVKWKVTLRRNGKVAAKGSRRTKAPSGSFSFERRLANGAGKDRISARATSPSGEVCTASLSF